MPNFWSRKARSNTTISELYEAVAARANDRVQQLINEHNINHRDKNGKTPLHWAAINGCYAVAKTLLGHPKIDFKRLDCLGKPAMHYAVHHAAPHNNQDKHVVQAFLQDPQDETRKHLAVRDKVKRTVLHEAVDRGSHEVIQQCSRPEVVPLFDAHKLTALHYAARHGNGDATWILLSNGAKAMAEDEDGKTALHWSARYDHDNITEMLVSEGAKHMSIPEKQLALHIAVMYRKHAPAMLLLEDHELEDKQEEEALLLAHNIIAANKQTREEDKQTLLWWAASQGHDALVTMLLEAGVKADYQDLHGRVPLVSVAQGGHEAMVKMLLQAGAKVDVKDYRRMTPLSMVAEGGHEAIVKTLLQARAAEVDFQSSSGDNTTPGIAVKGGHEATVKAA